MMRRMLLLALVLLVFGVAGAFAQGFSVAMYYLPENGTPLVTVCGGATPVPDGRVIKIFWDNDNNGADIDDPQAPLCLVPPDCETGPVGTHNYNEFAMNGTSGVGAAGYFATEQNFISAGAVPAPATFYLRVYEPDATTILWTSSVKTFVSGPQDVFFVQADWACGATGPQCVVLDEQE